MAYEGALATAAITQALAAIPQSIQSLLSLLKSGATNADITVPHVESIVASLSVFSSISSWLDEAKQIHETLQRFDNILEPGRHAYKTAISDGPFNPQKYDVEEVRKNWMVCENIALSPLYAIGRTLENICEPLVLDKDGSFVSGPDWASNFLLLQKRVRSAFCKYDTGEYQAIADISDLFDQVNHAVKTEMYLIDERMRKEANTLSDLLSKLRFSLDAIPK